jgi:hypothetical protein
MPNLKQIESFRSKYSTEKLTESRVNLRQIKALNENFNKSSYQIKSFFSLQGIDDHIVQFLEEQKSAKCCIVIY